MRISTVSIVSIAALTSLACSKPPPAAPAPDPRGEAAVAQLDRFRVDACACTDLTCALAVAGKRAEWLAGEHGTVRFTPEQQAAADTANQGFTTCIDAQTTTAPDDGAAAVRDFQAVADEMCACTAKPCAEQITARMMQLVDRYRDTKASAEHMAAMAPITERIAACLATAMATP